MRVAIFLAAILGCSLAVPVKDLSLRQRLGSEDENIRRNAVSDLINQLFDLIRDVMLNGAGVVPVLDPFVLEKINLDGNIVGLPDAYVSLEGLSVKGLSTFEVEELTTSSFLLRYTVNFNVKIPAVDVNTDNYDMYFRIFGGEIFGKGDMKLRIVNPRVKGSVVVGIRLAWGAAYLTINDCNVGIGLDDFEPVITGMFGNQVSSDFVSEFLKILVPELLNYFEDDITNILSTAVITIGNSILEDLNLIDIIGDILP